MAADIWSSVITSSVMSGSVSALGHLLMRTGGLLYCSHYSCLQGKKEGERKGSEQAL